MDTYIVVVSLQNDLKCLSFKEKFLISELFFEISLNLIHAFIYLLLNWSSANDLDVTEA